MTRRDVLGKNDVSVILEWTPEISGLTYNINVLPSALVRFRRSTSVDITAAYNTLYNVSVVPSLCGEYGTTTSFKLNFGEFTDAYYMQLL